ncbi:3-ketoacyl-ACP synthase [Solibacillus sp. R5-41]|uniref:elongation factor P 5-aminopentanone reductase n=1 Tax=Solibacillus sp. R5-41 TaxID=2048654 RepID=UPI000C126FCB|nr:SDR family oxidoreductase [Solibacillus sp. R5-41]ATP39414.1 3-ketoacyl-ACP synthase [Solibacillus sp. R5-41]
MKKFALVCGASGEIGQSICRKLAEDGWSLYLHYNANVEKVQELLEQLAVRYPKQEFLIVHADFSLDDGAQTLASQIYSLQAILFANGHAYYGLLEDTPVNEMVKLWKVHVQNPMHATALLASKLRANPSSYILLIGSIWGDAGAAGEVVYSAVKGAQHSFVKAYAQEVAYNGIRVNCIAPGIIDTNMNAMLNDQERADIVEQIPLQAFGKPDDIANMVAFLFSGQADYMTGQILRVNGGWYI